jgi:CRISPR-associated protein Cas1
MATLHVDRRDAVLAYRDGAVEVRAPDAVPLLTPLRGLERIVVSGSATVSTGLLAQCWARGVGLLVLSGRRSEPTARLFGAPHGDAALRVAQAVASRDEDACRAFAAEIIAAKIARQARLLRRLAEARPGGRALLGGAPTTLYDALRRARSEPGLDVAGLRGLEGAAAAAYFAAFARFFPPGLGFSQRVRRPPTDPVNAALSLGYTLATFEAGRQAQLAGIDPAIGALHGLAHGRDAAALDLVEPARPGVDAIVHELFRARTLARDHFQTAPDGAVTLGKAGRARFYEAWRVAAPSLKRLLRRAARRGVARLRERAGS